MIAAARLTSSPTPVVPLPPKAVARSPAPAPAPDARPPAAPAPITVDGARLQGVLGRAAVFAGADGAQRLVRVGREAAPGIVLAAVGHDHAMLARGAARLRVDLDPARDPSPKPVSVNPVASPVRVAATDAETLRYRLALAPRRAGGRVTGFVLRPGAVPPVLARAGLRPGDVLVMVNGQTFESEEKLLGLAEEIRTTRIARFEFERGTERRSAEVPINSSENEVSPSLAL